ncbi:MAG: cyclase family protein [Terriglobales bacterium]|jgi:kynurenine formamidase
MRIRSFIIAYALVLAILLFADRRPGPAQEDRYSRVVDLTAGETATVSRTSMPESRTHIIAPGALIPGTWTAGQIPPQRLIAPLVVMDLSVRNTLADGSAQISLDDIAAWESHNGMIPQGAVVAIRRVGSSENLSDNLSMDMLTPFPIAHDAAMFLIEARNTIGFAVETPVNIIFDRTLAQQLALHGNYVLEGAERFTSLPATGSLIIVAPAKDKKPGSGAVRILAMVR